MNIYSIYTENYKEFTKQSWLEFSPLAAAVWRALASEPFSNISSLT